MSVTPRIDSRNRALGSARGNRRAWLKRAREIFIERAVLPSLILRLEGKWSGQSARRAARGDVGRVRVALMTNPNAAEPCGVHRTFLNADGTKRDRKMWGKQGVVCLSPNDTVTARLGVTEGIEDGMAVLLSGWGPVWAATSAGAIERFPHIKRHGVDGVCRRRPARHESSGSLCGSLARVRV